MNSYIYDILRTLFKHPNFTQRSLSEAAGVSLGVVNNSLRELYKAGYLSADYRLTDKAVREYNEKKPRNAIILAAGFGMRMVPINTSGPKALLEINGEPLIERLIDQLHEIDVKDITIVVGFMKECFDYLIDKYNVTLVYNPYYATQNNLTSLALVAEKIENTYILPADIRCEINPFRLSEFYSWYMVSDKLTPDSEVRVNRKRELVKVASEEMGNSMIGIAYLLKKDGDALRKQIRMLREDPSNSNAFWETALYHKNKMQISARVFSAKDVVEINTYEQLRDLDSASQHLKSDALDVISNVFQTGTMEIKDITVLKKGMTNRSFLFSVKGEKYIMRIPGEGTDQLINRTQESNVYKAISGFGLCDDPVYLDPIRGFKITRYLENTRVADPKDESDLRKCIKKLRDFHNLHLCVQHEFDLFGQIQFYESLRGIQASVYRDYQNTKQNVFSLREYIENQPKTHCLTHIDAVPDNFLFYTLPDEKEGLQLTDWEYAGMQDPHLDLAMWSVYSFYEKKEIDHLIDLYFETACNHEVRAKIYCYIAAAGLLWSNWCEYKSTLGVEFGEYAMKQYRYAKEYYHYAMEELHL